MKKWLILFLTIGTLILSACSSDDTRYNTISLEAVEEKMKEGYIVLDVREVNEYEQGHIPSAENKPLSILQQGDFSGLSKEENYVVICRSGNRSQTASDLLHKEGFHVMNVSEGMSSWTGPTE